MAQKIYITTTGKEKIWRERPDGHFTSTKSKFLLSHTDIQKGIVSGHLKEVPDGDGKLTMPLKNIISKSKQLF